ncbi:HAD-IA family hydrolase [Streptomyces sp. S3(2020)]|uniref:HAD family hydrolase n=1 Tax=Streptomyces sp. S3(2020) TaxID=2732044 RepID=UPI001487C346|nr:HAD-IA family hydrolase [Streptomyces sp. S3(2020)]NNN34517.1 HAD-IA family hydrolase [Streptomyces sp. S3(2020)]
MAVEAGTKRGGQPLLSGIRGVLFDFDGPVCRLFPNESSRPVADELRDMLVREGVKQLLTASEEQNKDPHVVLQAVHRGRPKRDQLVRAMEELVSRREVAATQKALPTPGAVELIHRLWKNGLRLAVVTNNSPSAADRYLRDWGVRDQFGAIHGRSSDPDLMKPHPHVVLCALRSLGLGPTEAVMIGDTPTDLEAARHAGVRFIGYGRNELKQQRLRDAGAEDVLGAYAPLLDEMGEKGAAAHEPGARSLGEPAACL